MTEEVRFPLTFDTCPNLIMRNSKVEVCGSKRRVAESIVKEEIEKGRLSKEAQGGTRLTTAILGDPRGIAISVPAILISYDICVDCGWEYVTQVNKTTATPQMMPPPKHGTPPGFPMGRG